MELLGVEVVEEDVEAEDFLHDGEWGLFGCEDGDGRVVQDEDGYGVPAVDFVGELCLGEVGVELGVFRERGEDLGDVVGGNGGDRESDEQEV